MNKFFDLKVNSDVIKNGYMGFKSSPHWHNSNKLWLNERGEFTFAYNVRNTIESSKEELFECYHSHKELHEEEGNYYYLDLTNKYNYENVKSFENFFLLRSRDSLIENMEYKKEIIEDFASKVDTIIILNKKYMDTEVKKLLNDKIIKYKYKDINICNNPCDNNCINEDKYYYKFGNKKELSKFLLTVQLNIKDDKGLELWFGFTGHCAFYEYFITLAEHREKRIDEILE